MREAAEKKKELEKQHSEAVTDLRTAQAQLGLLASNKNTEVERAQHSQNIESLQSRIRELERKMELQNVRHDELLLELAALRRNHNSAGGGGGGGGSNNGSSQSLSATFDLDSRGSTPGRVQNLFFLFFFFNLSFTDPNVRHAATQKKTNKVNFQNLVVVVLDVVAMQNRFVTLPTVVDPHPRATETRRSVKVLQVYTTHLLKWTWPSPVN